MLRELPYAKKVIKMVIKRDEELLPWLERVRKEGITLIAEREGVPNLEIVRVEERRPGVVFPRVSLESTATKEDIQKALSAAGTWKDVDTEALLHDIFEARHHPETRPPVTFDD